MFEKHRLHLNVDLPQIFRHYQKMSEVVKPAKILPVLKADAYGLGAVEIGRYLSEKGVSIVGVADIGEALVLKEFFSEIHILGAVFDAEIPLILENNWVCPITSVTRLKAWQELIKNTNKKLRVQLYLDTGMGQLGLTYEGVIQACELLLKAKDCFEIVGLYSHFSDGDKANDLRSLMQLELFQKVAAFVRSNVGEIPYLHIGNSSAINFMPASYQGFTYIRTGINLYGVHKNLGVMSHFARSAVTLTSHVISVRNVKMGESIGYLHTFTAEKNLIVATIPAGYADGIPFGAKNLGYVLIHGSKCKVLGRISMDYFSVDVAHLPSILVGDLVTLIGKDGEHEITIEDWALLRQTIPYEVICSLNTPRVVHYYKR